MFAVHFIQEYDYEKHLKMHPLHGIHGFNPCSTRPLQYQEGCKGPRGKLQVVNQQNLGKTNHSGIQYSIDMYK